MVSRAAAEGPLRMNLIVALFGVLNASFSAQSGQVDLDRMPPEVRSRIKLLPQLVQARLSTWLLPPSPLRRGPPYGEFPFDSCRGKAEHHHTWTTSSTAVPLVVGCGRSGTHALAAALTGHGITATHEKYSLGSPAVSWRATGLAYASRYWGVGVCWYAPLMVLHRGPLQTIASLARGFNGRGACSGRAAEAADRFSWDYAARFVQIPPLEQLRGGVHENGSLCKMPRTFRLELALHYYVKWTALSDALTSLSFRLEDMTLDSFVDPWCAFCDALNQTQHVSLQDGGRSEMRYHCQCPRHQRGQLRNVSVVPTGQEVARGSTLPRGGVDWAELHAIDRELTAAAKALATMHGYD